MADIEKVIKGIECCECPTEKGFVRECSDCPYYCGSTIKCRVMLKIDALKLLKEQEKLVDVDALREKLGLAKDCAKCKQNTRACQYDSHFSLMDFCERFDMAIEELMQEGR